MTATDPRTERATRPAAFFDLDRTLVSGSSGFSMLIEMTKLGIVRRRQLARDVSLAIRFRLWGLDDATTDAARLRVLGYIAGVEQQRLHAMGDGVLHRVLPRVYPEVLARAHAHQAAGQPTYLVTASSQEFAEVLASTLGFDGAVGTRSEIIDGRYTGRPGGPFIYGEGKVDALNELADEHHLDLTGSYAYSDSISDLPMLRAVGQPIAVNPDRELRRIASAEGWEILTIDHLGRRLSKAAMAALALLTAGIAGSRTVRRRRAQQP